MRSIITEYDWSAADKKYLLAVAVLRDDFDTAAYYRLRLHPDEMPEIYYRE
jgi:hypothetical protein